MLERVKPFLREGINIKDNNDWLECPIVHATKGLEANATYFGKREWAGEYLTYCHRSDAFKSRWLAAVENWNEKIVIDIGCGPGNIYASLGGNPKLLIGIDVAKASLQLAKEQGYLPVLADANNLPFISGFADIVTLNATLHHCDDMESVLKEAARLVKPGGMLITDHDPQLSAWDYKGLAKLLWNIRLVVYKIAKKGFHKSNSQQYWALACELHHKPGDGVTKKMFYEILESCGFKVNVYPHNHELGSEVLLGNWGKAEKKYWIANLLSGRNPRAEKSALSLMCIAKKMA